MNWTNHSHPGEVGSPADGSRVRMIYQDFCLASRLGKKKSSRLYKITDKNGMMNFKPDTFI